MEMLRIKKYELYDVINKFNEFYKTSSIFNFEQYGKNYRFIKFNGISQKDLINKYLNEFFEKVKPDENTFIKLNMMYENKKIDKVQYYFGNFTQIWIHNPPKDIFEIYLKTYKLADRGRFCIYYHTDENGTLLKEKSCIVIELLGNHIQIIKNNYFLQIKKSIEKNIYETKIKDINHYAYFIKYFDTKESYKLKKSYDITYGNYDKYNNYEPVNEFELLDVRISEEKKYLISRDWY
jgi:hypothetical protein